MPFYHCSVERSAGRCLFFFVASAVFTLAIPVASTKVVFAQAASKGLEKGAEKDASDPAQPERPKLDAAYLIGDAVDDADSPQYRDVASAIARFGNGDFSGARELLAEARTKHPELPPVEVIVAKLFITYQRPDVARRELEQAVRRAPKDPEAYLMFADAAIADRPAPRVTDAEALYQKADGLVRAFNENAKRKQNFEKRVLNGLAMVAESRSQWAAAESLLRELIKRDPKNASAHQRLGGVLFQQATPGDQKKLSESFKEFVAAVEADPRAIKPNVAMARLFEQAAQEARNANDDARFKKMREQAKESFTRATTGQHADLNSFLAAATWALQTSQLPLARQYAESAMKMDPDSIEAKLARALVARFSEDMPTAERYLNEAFLQAPASFPVSNQLALVLIESPDKSKQNRALQLADMNYRQYQQNAEAVSTLGWVYYRLGRTADAGRVLEAVANARALTPDSAYYVAEILAGQDRTAEAMQILQQALANPQPFANRPNAEELLEKVRRAAQSRASQDTKEGTDSKAGTSSKTKDAGTKSSAKGKASK